MNEKEGRWVRAIGCRFVEALVKLEVIQLQ